MSFNLAKVQNNNKKSKKKNKIPRLTARNDKQKEI